MYGRPSERPRFSELSAACCMDSDVSVTRTINPLHLEDLDPRRFEDLARDLVFRFRRWHHLEPRGRLGRDGGVDIMGLEVVDEDPIADERDEDDDSSVAPAGLRKWVVQCKRWQRLSPSDVRAAVAETVAGETAPPHGILLVAACDVSAEGFAAFHEEAASHGAVEHHLWTRSIIEEQLFRPENDHLLFAFFGISLGVRRSTKVRELRRQLAIKRKLLRACGLQSGDIASLLYNDLLLRDVGSLTYPYDDRGEPLDPACTMRSPLQEVRLEQVAPEGIWVARVRCFGWFKEDGTWDAIEDSRVSAGHVSALRQRSRRSPDKGRDAYRDLFLSIPQSEQMSVVEVRHVPYDRLIEVDPIGDSWFPGVHVLVQHSGEGGPYDQRFSLVGEGSGACGPRRELSLEDRRPYFDAAIKGAGTKTRSTSGKDSAPLSSSTKTTIRAADR